MFTLSLLHNDLPRYHPQYNVAGAPEPREPGYGQFITITGPSSPWTMVIDLPHFLIMPFRRDGTSHDPDPMIMADEVVVMERHPRHHGRGTQRGGPCRARHGDGHSYSTISSLTILPSHPLYKQKETATSSEPKGQDKIRTSRLYKADRIVTARQVLSEVAFHDADIQS